MNGPVSAGAPSFTGSPTHPSTITASLSMDYQLQLLGLRQPKPAILDHEDQDQDGAGEH